MSDLDKAGLYSVPVTLIILSSSSARSSRPGSRCCSPSRRCWRRWACGRIPSQIWPSDESLYAMILLIGLAVGVDYSMFYLKREREERAAGRSAEEALEVAAATSGRSVLVSGATVIIAMAGMLFAGAVLRRRSASRPCSSSPSRSSGSLTVLPAVLSKLGDNVDRLRVPFVHRHTPRRRRGPDLGRDRRPRAAPAGALGRARRRAARCAIAVAGAQAAHRRAGHRHVPAATRRAEDLQPAPGGVPRHRDPGERRRQGGRRRLRPTMQAAIAELRSSARSPPGSCTSRSSSTSTTRRHRRERRDPGRRQRQRRALERRARGAARRHRPGDRRRVAGRRGRPSAGSPPSRRTSTTR